LNQPVADMCMKEAFEDHGMQPSDVGRLCIGEMLQATPHLIYRREGVNKSLEWFLHLVHFKDSAIGGLSGTLVRMPPSKHRLFSPNLGQADFTWTLVLDLGINSRACIVHWWSPLWQHNNMPVNAILRPRMRLVVSFGPDALKVCSAWLAFGTPKDPSLTKFADELKAEIPQPLVIR
jgi:hypothetical protein